MTTDLPSNIRPPKTSDAYAMAVAGVKNIVGVAEVDGKSRFVVPVEAHPGFRGPKASDSYQMAAQGITSIRGAIETSRSVQLVTLQQRACIL